MTPFGGDAGADDFRGVAGRDAIFGIAGTAARGAGGREARTAIRGLG